MSFSKTVHFSKVTVLSNIYFSEHWNDSFQLSITDGRKYAAFSRYSFDNVFNALNLQ